MREQLPAARLVVCDTMDLWIHTTRDELMKTLAVVDGVIINDSEALQLTGQSNPITAGREVLRLGPRFVVVKKGEHGSMLISRDSVAVLPAYPTTNVVDPTGAGDSFAGGMMGYLASRDDLSMTTLKQALARGTITASFTIEDFSMRRIEKVTTDDLNRRLNEYCGMLKLT